jgi:hypothetical protein
MSGYSVRDLIKDWWPEHLGCLTSYGSGRKDNTEGVICGCGAILGYPTMSDEFAGRTTDTRRDPLAPTLPADTSPSYPAGGQLGDDWQGPTVDDSPPWDTSDQEPAVTASPAFNVDPAADAIDALVPAGGAMPSSAVVPYDPIESALVAIDPTKIYTAMDIEMQLVSIEARLEQGQLFQRVWEMRALSAEIAYELAYAQAITDSEATSADRRKAEAILACQEQLVAKLTAKTMSKAVADTMHNLRSMLSGYQSIARSVGSSMSAAGMDVDNARERYAGIRG